MAATASAGPRWMLSFFPSGASKMMCVPEGDRPVVASHEAVLISISLPDSETTSGLTAWRAMPVESPTPFWA